MLMVCRELASAVACSRHTTSMRAKHFASERIELGIEGTKSLAEGAGGAADWIKFAFCGKVRRASAAQSAIKHETPTRGKADRRAQPALPGHRDVLGRDLYR